MAQRHVVCVAVLGLLAAAGTGCMKRQMTDLQTEVSSLHQESRDARTESQRNAAGLEQNLRLIKQDTDHLRARQTEMDVTLERMARELEVMQAKVEELNHRLSGRSVESAPPAGGEPPAGSAPRAAGDAAPSVDRTALRDQLYQAAYDHFIKGKFDLAIQGFQDFLQQFPEGDLADNAAFWIGECEYSLGRFRQAVDAFNRVIQEFPTGNKVPAAMLKMGYAQLELGQVEAGRATLQGLKEKFPGSEEAKLAEERLRLFQSY